MMRKKLIPFSKPWFTKKEEREIIDTIRTGWITSGPKMVQFEKEFASYIGTKYALSTASGTAALHLSLLALEIGTGDEVITTSFTWAATANVIVNIGAKPVFVDIDKITHNIDHKLIEAKITSRTKAIIPVHFAGLPCDMNSISQIARKNGLYIIEDAAHALGSMYNGKKIGALSDLTCFSFHPIKNITTAEGGMITTNRDDLAEKIKLLRFHGVTKDAWSRYSESTRDNFLYDIILPGFKYNMTDLQASLGIHQLRKIEKFIQKRSYCASIYNRFFSEIEEIIKPYPGDENMRHSWNLYTIKINPKKTKVSRIEFMRKLKQRNIGSGIHFLALHLSSYYQKLGYKRGDLPNTEFISDNIVTIPLYPQITDGELKYVALSIKDILTNR